jgi:proteic killer suppression protein
MDVEFDDDRLRRLCEEPGYRLPSLAPEIARAFRNKVQVVRAAFDERDLHALKSLHFEKLRGKRAGQHSLRLNERWRLIVRMTESEPGHDVVHIVEVTDYHQ